MRPPFTSPTSTASQCSVGPCGACASRAGHSTWSSSTTAPATARWSCCARSSPEVTVLELERNIGFGPAINRAVARAPGRPADPPQQRRRVRARFVEALLDGLGGRRVGGRGAAPGTRPGADRLRRRGRRPHPDGLRLPARRAARRRGRRGHPLGPTGGAALYGRGAFEAVGGFDERIFLYYEDLDLALRMAARGGRCRLAPGATALHAYSASLGAASGRKYARTGWSRGYMLRRYGVMSARASRCGVLACEGAICAGQTAPRPHRQGPRRAAARLAATAPA